MLHSLSQLYFPFPTKVRSEHLGWSSLQKHCSHRASCGEGLFLWWYSGVPSKILQLERHEVRSFLHTTYVTTALFYLFVVVVWLVGLFLFWNRILLYGPVHLELAMYLRLVLNLLQSSCFSLPNARITNVYYHIGPKFHSGNPYN